MVLLLFCIHYFVFIYLFIFQYRLEKALKINAMYFSRANKGVVNMEVISPLLMKLGIEDIGVHDYMCRHYDKDYNGEYSYYEFLYVLTSSRFGNPVFSNFFCFCFVFFQIYFKKTSTFMYSIGTIHGEFISADTNKDHTISQQGIFLKK